MSSALKHKQRSRKTHGPILFKSKECAFHDFKNGRVVYKNSKNNKKY